MKGCRAPRFAVLFRLPIRIRRAMRGKLPSGGARAIGRWVAAAIAIGALVSGAAAAAADAAAHDPEHAAYASAEVAFRALFIDSGLGERAYRENREYAAAIYQMPDGTWHGTTPVAGGRMQSAIPYHAVPEAAVSIVGAHTHGQPHIPEDPRRVYGVDFSQADLRNAVHNYRASQGRIAAQMLLTSDLRILRLTLSGSTDPSQGDTVVTSLRDARFTSGPVHGQAELLGYLVIATEPARVALENHATPRGRALVSSAAGAARTIGPL